MTDYERYQLQWMIDHGHSLKELADGISAAQSDGVYAQDAFQTWERDTGFGGEIWACPDEWLDERSAAKSCRRCDRIDCRHNREVERDDGR